MCCCCQLRVSKRTIGGLDNVSCLNTAVGGKCKHKDTPEHRSAGTLQRHPKLARREQVSQDGGTLEMHDAQGLGGGGAVAGQGSSWNRESDRQKSEKCLPSDGACSTANTTKQEPKSVKTISGRYGHGRVCTYGCTRQRNTTKRSRDHGKKERRGRGLLAAGCCWELCFELPNHGPQMNPGCCDGCRLHDHNRGTQTKLLFSLT